MKHLYILGFQAYLEKTIERERKGLVALCALFVYRVMDRE